MKKLYIIAAAILSVGASQPAAAQVIFGDQFNGRAGAVDTNKWIGEFHEQGSGKFIGPGRKNGRGAVSLNVRRNFVQNGRRTFSMQNMKSRRKFHPGNGTLTMQARVRVAHNQPGIVHGFFLYEQAAFNGNKSNELDFEWLTKKTSNRRSDEILVSTWKNWNRNNIAYDVVGHPVHGTHKSIEKTPGVDANGWHVYTIVWRRGHIVYKIDGRKIHEFRGGPYAPDKAMHLHFNSWVPDSSWEAAFAPGFRPSAHDRRAFPMEVDWVRITKS